MEPHPLHGQVSFALFKSTRLLRENKNQPSSNDLETLALAMQDPPDLADDSPDPEENLKIPAGYTYFGQFIDHDLTFDTTSTLDVKDNTKSTDARTPRFDLDNLYGSGPDAMPYMFNVDGIHLIADEFDLPRASNKRAIIGDPRDDENSIVCNLQMAFISFHNRIVDRISAQQPALQGTALFKRAQQEVTWTYQRIIVEDFLKRVVNPKTLAAFEAARNPDARGLTQDESAYVLYKKTERNAIPLEFSGAAYRFGHSMVRSGYRLSDVQKAPLQIFLPPPDNGAGPGSLSPEDSLVGFAPLPRSQFINNWARFFPSPQAGAVVTPGMHNAQPDPNQPNASRLQYAYRIDTALENPLAHLPTSVATGEFKLAARNLLRGAKFELATGQELAEALGVQPLDVRYLVTRTKSGNDKIGITEQFVPIAPNLQAATPLWFYILAEAQAPVVDWAATQGGSFKEDAFLAAAAQTTTQLGEVGGRIVLEVFNGLLDIDQDSYRNSPDAVGWTPMIGTPTMWNLLSFS